MSYLRLARGQLALALFLACALLLWAFPTIDLAFSRLFFAQGFVFDDQRWQVLIQRGLTSLLVACLLLFVGVYLLNQRSGRALWGIDGRKVFYLFAVLIVGAGLIVNLGLKDHMGRARPRDVAEFNGTREFTPAFAASQQCERNCSFPSGDGAAAFFFLAVARMLRKHRAAFIAALSLGVLVSLSRIASGAHFLSDAVVSFFVMWLVADCAFHYLFERFAFQPRYAFDGGHGASPRNVSRRASSASSSRRNAPSLGARPRM